MVKRGFSLIELLVVLAILAALVAIAVPRYHSSVVRAKDAVLRENLLRMREAIAQYAADRGHAPSSLEALAGAGYLRAVPEDPWTGTGDSWVPVAREGGGMRDVRSGAPGYEDW